MTGDDPLAPRNAVAAPEAGATEARATTGVWPVDETEAVPVAWEADGGTTLAEPEAALDPYPEAGTATTGTGADPSPAVRTVGSEFLASSATSGSLPVRAPEPTADEP
jgi:hypothetical protein